LGLPGTLCKMCRNITMKREEAQALGDGLEGAGKEVKSGGWCGPALTASRGVARGVELRMTDPWRPWSSANVEAHGDRGLTSVMRAIGAVLLVGPPLDVAKGRDTLEIRCLRLL